MRDALIRDVAEYANITTTHDTRLPAPELGSSFAVDVASDVNNIWRQQMQQADDVWLIAPETDGVLYALTAQAKALGKTVIGAGLNAIALTASKRQTAQHLAQHHIPVVPCLAADDLPDDQKLWVLKADDGVGCESILLGSKNEILDAIEADEGDADNLIIQPHLKGRSASLSVCTVEGEYTVLSYNWQQVEQVSRGFCYAGGVLNGAIAHQGLLTGLVGDIQKAIPDLQGFWGVDVMIDEAQNTATVLEINPRLTTPYAYLRQAMQCNPVEMLMNSLKQKQLVKKAFSHQEVTFHV